jgi:IS5 family transposase
MIRSHSHNQLTLAEFDWPFQVALDEKNRWVKISQLRPWDALADGYYQNLSTTQGRPAKDARLVIGAVIIKHKLCLSDEETVCQIQKNPYLQYFVGLPGYQMAVPAIPSLLVEVRKRMGQNTFDTFHEAIIGQLDKIQSNPSSTDPDDNDPDDQSPPGPVLEPAPKTHQGKLILDATVFEQAIRYPTDLSLLNEAREMTEQIIDTLYPLTPLTKKPRTYRETARSAYLAIVKQRRPGGRVVRKGIHQQCQYLRRNLGHIDTLLSHWPEGTRLPLPNWLQHRYWVIQHLYQQQWAMYQTKTRRCDDRIVSIISQPHVRPIVRGKLNK